MAQDLPVATLGRTGLPVTRLGYGATEIRGAPGGRPITDDEAAQILNAVLDAGINYLDTSIDYGRSEELIGKYISHRRSEFYLASKCGCPVGDLPPREHVFTRDNIVAGVHQSLTRLQTDYLDAVQFHASPSRAVLEQENAIQTLLDLQQAGKIRFLGSSATLPHLPDHIAMGVFDVFQIPYSALEREHEDWITKAAEAGAGIVIRGGVAQGQPGEGMGRAEKWQRFDEASLDDLREEGESRTAFLLRFTLSHPHMHTTIVATKNPEHLKENLRAVQAGPLPADVYAEAKRRLAGAGLSPAPVS
ncbi:MAG: aldo/keto reductase [Dehalococcoidia bacterium]|nr:aldo/keto reductase [Dehalococcoidia bacterium]